MTKQRREGEANGPRGQRPDGASRTGPNWTELYGMMRGGGGNVGTIWRPFATMLERADTLEAAGLNRRASALLDQSESGGQKSDGQAGGRSAWGLAAGVEKAKVFSDLGGVVDRDFLDENDIQQPSNGPTSPPATTFCCSLGQVSGIKCYRPDRARAEKPYQNGVPNLPPERRKREASR